MKLIPSDVTEAVCQRCAACCESVLKVAGDMRDLERLEMIYGDRLTVSWRGECTCGCGALKYEGIVTERCPALKEEEGHFLCSEYAERPQFCRDYNCVTWALVHGHEDGPHTEAAREALSQLETAVTPPPSLTPVRTG